MSQPFLLDVDTGIDDALALLYAVACPEIDLRGVSCVAGNVPVDDVVRNTISVLDMAGRSDIEVCRGAGEPIARPLVTTPETHGPNGVGYALTTADPGRVSARSGPELIVDTVMGDPHNVTLVTLGPLTNLALALERVPKLLDHVRRLVVMGGCFSVAGNTAPRTEWNIHVDPEAARAVFEVVGRGSAGLPLILPLDVTEHARLEPHHVMRIARPAGDPLLSENPLTASGKNPVVAFLAEALRFYMDFHQRFDGFYGAFIHDPFAVAAAVDPTLVRVVETTVDIETEGRLTTGETVADLRNAWDRPANAAVALQGYADAFLRRFVSRLAVLAGEIEPAEG